MIIKFLKPRHTLPSTSSTREMLIYLNQDTKGEYFCAEPMTCVDLFRLESDFWKYL